jgi:hypothetical protein
MDVGATCGTGGVKGTAWGVTKVGKAGDEGAMQVWRSDRLGSRSDYQPLYGGGLTAWACSLTASLSSRGGLTTWTRGLTTSFCFRHSQTAQTCSLTASCGQQWKARQNKEHRQWCGHGSRTGRVIL